MLDFAWDSFKDGNFAVLCKTEQAANNFLEEVRNTDIDYYEINFSTWGMFEEETCYFIDMRDKLDLCNVGYCNWNNIQIIEWEIGE